MRQKNYKSEILSTIKEIFKKFPNQLVSTHLSLAFSDYASIDGISDKEILFLLDKYKYEKELDIEIQHDASIDRIIEEGQNLSITNLYDIDEEDLY